MADNQGPSSAAVLLGIPERSGVGCGGGHFVGAANRTGIARDAARLCPARRR